MHDARSWIVAWQSLAPVVAGIFTIAMMKWFSSHWAAATVRRTARVASKLRSPAGSQRIIRR
jgi:hypothetical protein